MKLRIAVAPPALDWASVAFAEFVDGLEAKGFDTMWLSDVPLASAIDPLAGLSFAAGRTHRLKLGANFVPLGRHPLLLAKEMAQIDRLSGGRLLCAMVPGLGSSAERRALGVAGADRGALLDEVLPLLRRLWSGEPVTFEGLGIQLSEHSLRPTPLQSPLEIWLGGMGPKALQRAGRLSDGWLGAAVTPAEAGSCRREIEKAAAEAGRSIDPEHFGLSIAYAREEAPPEALAALAGRRPGTDPHEMFPAGRAGLRGLLGALADEGLSKFVLRPSGRGPVADELDWLAEAVLDLQT